ncbi:hypothetical protein [Neobacillus sp. FSL H8-0543]|uniref:hypothetical protein n=1 Tax=Neobacillus sp. FSL H8-0543 TaxID=2954672 RepID=UPI0031582279
MKNLKMFLISILFVFGLSYVVIESNQVSADDDFEEKYEIHEEDDDEEGTYEEIGKTIGWGTVIAMGAAGLIFPIRRSAKWIITNYPKSKNIFISISKFLGKYHLYLGLIALALSIFHGVAMYLSEGKLESEGIIGLGAVIFMMIAGILGTVLFRNKKVNILRTTHTTLIAFALLIGFVHIITS